MNTFYWNLIYVYWYTSIIRKDFIIFKKEIKSSKNPIKKLKEKEEEYANLFANPYNAASRGYIDEVVIPSSTRKKLIKAFKNWLLKKIYSSFL